MWIVLALISSTLAEPQAPRYPDTFTQSFSEIFSYPILGNHTTTGTYYYDWTTKRYRIDRANGRFDRYCGTNGFKLFYDTACSQFVVDGDRYLYYPEVNECCYCCSADHGCGIIKPDWMNGAQYLGVEDFSGQKANKWDNPGLQHNYYYETTEEEPLDRTLLAIHQMPNDLQYYNQDRKLSVDYGVLELPNICQKSKTCSFFSVCTALR